MPKWLLSTEMIHYTVSDRVARITLNRPEKRNALHPQLLRELHQALLESDDRTDVNVIVIEGAGKDFCAGYDLDGVYAGRKAQEEALAREADPTPYRSMVQTYDDDCWGLERMQQELLAIFDLHKPVIAKVHGNCLAGGTDLALSCDLVVCADDARIGFPATRAGGTPPIHWWIYHVGPQWAKRILMTGDSLSGKDAAILGLALESVPAGELNAEIDELARRISLVDHELLACHKRVVNLAIELQGGRTLQRLASELDARAHLSQGPARTRFKTDMTQNGLRAALRNRDEPFGDGMVKLKARKTA